MRKARLGDLEGHALVGGPRPRDGAQAVRHETTSQLGPVQVLCEGLGADVRPCSTARKDECRSRVRRQSLLLLDEGEDEGRQGHAVLSVFLHRRRGYRERRVLDPLFADRCGFTGAEHRRKLKEEEHLHPSRSLRHDPHDGRQLFPVDGRHRRHDGRGEDAAHSFDGVVLDKASAHRQVEDLSGAHQDAFQSGSLARLVEALDGVDDKRRRDLVELSGSDRADEVPLEATTLVLIGHDAPALQAAPKLESVA